MQFTSKLSSWGWLKSVGLIALIGGFGKILSMLKEIYIAQEFGVGEVLETYYLLILIPVFVANSISGSIAKIVIPNIQNEVYLRSAFTYFIQIFILGSLVTLLGTYFYFNEKAPDLFHVDTGTFSLLFLLTLSVLLQGVNSYLLAIVEAEGKFFASSFHSIFLSIFLIIFIWNSPTLTNLILAFFLSYIAMFFLLLFNVTNKRLLVPYWKVDAYQDQRASYNLLLVSSLIGGGAFFVDQLMANHFFDFGISLIQYSNRIVLLISSFLALAVGNVLLREFSLVSDFEAQKLLKNSTMLILIIGSVIAIILYFLGFEVVTFFFQRGAFTANETKLVSPLLQVYACTIPFYVLKYVFGAYLASKKAYKPLLYIAIFSLFSNVILNFILIDKCGIQGIALSTVFSFLFTSLFGLFLIRNWHKNRIIN